ncbi:hypothetical protein Poli38472_006984 [Pythium oligandrum]|uniref:FAD-binding FR-type domain-containing protein n=1 Tax=Pythium oligandrum TaxID=41045 RepID=A0A8K1C8W7_PYTOL|nr:hypothetical protein Poli38472_006984 [Pythium oligandrum]|eukprot:TMW58839.1 hypothetical protein Poli38472_006984 [Pythium oligandrum]
MAVFLLAQVVYFHDYFTETLKPVILAWWGPDHEELLRPTYFTVFAVFPAVFSLVLIELRRDVGENGYFSSTLRRKPALFACFSPWSIGEWLFLLVLVGGNVSIFRWVFLRRLNRIRATFTEIPLHDDDPISFDDYLSIIAVSLGSNCAFNLAFVFLPATRNSAWMTFFNISYANGVKYHRWIGIMTVFAAFAHGLGFTWIWIRKGNWKKQALPCFDCALDSFDGRRVWIHVFGELALLLFLIIGFTSVPCIRRKFYNLFYYAHQLFILAIVFSVLHWGPIVWWIFPTFLVYCYRRVISTSHAFSPVQVKELTALDNDIVKITLHRSTQTDGHFHVGQFLYINVPALSKLQWHAFTIASSPHANPTTLTLYIKSLGDWTRDLVTYANDCKQQDVLPTVYVDGYYGSSLGVYEEYSTLCLIGGGIGATPMFAILEDLVSKLSSGRGSSLRQRVVFVFSFRELSLLEELHPLLLRVKELDPHEQHFKLHFYLTRPVGDDVLSKSLDHERLQGFQQHIQPTQYSAVVTSKVPRAFYQPLRSRTSTVVVSLVVFVVAWILLVYLEYGNGKITQGGNRPELWPLQRVVEAFTLLLAGALVYIFIFAQRMSNASRSCTSLIWSTTPFMSFKEDFESYPVPAVPRTVRDLLHLHRVTMGQRPPIKEFLARVHDTHGFASFKRPSESSAVGVFVSGPSSMKRGVEEAVTALGSSRFEVHQEEFEL